VRLCFFGSSLARLAERAFERSAGSCPDSAIEKMLRDIAKLRQSWYNSDPVPE